jgi:pimeloyl-ACP methyl ester carboxylesterase
MPKLLSSENGSNHHQNTAYDSFGTVYGVDYLGQGRSWPMDCQDGNSENEKNVIYSIDTWADQVVHFIEEVIIPNHRQRIAENGADLTSNTKVHLVGNSVGGLIAVLIALKRPELIESICLLNATPVWGLNLPGWSGHLPPPPIPRWIGRYLFDRIRERNTIEKYLLNAYANPSAFGDELVRISSVTFL